MTVFTPVGLSDFIGGIDAQDLHEMFTDPNGALDAMEIGAALSSATSFCNSLEIPQLQAHVTTAPSMVRAYEYFHVLSGSVAFKPPYEHERLRALYTVAVSIVLNAMYEARLAR